MTERKVSVERNTLETQIKATINLDGTGEGRFAIGVPFMEHMLDQVARHGLIDIDVECIGDTHIDDHHTVEDVGITLAKLLQKLWVISAVYVAMATLMSLWMRHYPVLP